MKKRVERFAALLLAMLMLLAMPAFTMAEGTDGEDPAQTPALEEPTPTPEAKDEPTPTPEATDEPTPTPEAEDEPTPTPEPEEKKLKSNGEGDPAPADDSKEITVTAKSESRAYNGKPLKASDIGYTVTGLASGYTVTPTLTGEITDAGTTASTVGDVVVKDASGADVTTEFTITKVNGTLTVTPVKITLKSHTATKEYDGTALVEDDELMLTEGDFVGDEFIDFTVTGSQTNAGTSKNTFTYTLINGAKEANYSITKVEGDLTVTPREITLTSSSAKKTYDGTSLTKDEVKITKGSLVGTDKIEWTVTAAQLGAGTTKNTFTYTLVADNPDNYKITKVEGDLTVAKRKLTLTSHDAKKQYDGKPLVNTKITVGGDGLLKEEGIEFYDFSFKTNIGKCKNEFRYKFADGVNPDNYEVKQVFGTLKVSASGSSTQTGVDDHWPTLLGGSALLIAASAAIVVVLKKRSRRSNG